MSITSVVFFQISFLFRVLHVKGVRRTYINSKHIIIAQSSYTWISNFDCMDSLDATPPIRIVFIFYFFWKIQSFSSASVDVVLAYRLLPLILSLYPLISRSPSPINGCVVCCISTISFTSYGREWLSSALPFFSLFLPAVPLFLPLSLWSLHAVNRMSRSHTFSSPGTGGPFRTNCKRSG